MVSTKTVVVATAVTAAVAAVSYAAYFDYKRRNDRQFRRKLQKDRKKAEKAAGKSAKTASGDVEEQANELLNRVAKEKLPATAEEKEQFFMAQVSKGETLCSAGPEAYAEAACRFYQALKVYPNPIELVMIYQKTTPEPVFKLVMAMMAQEVRQKQARYYDVFPSKDKNVEIKDKNKPKKEKSKKGKKQEESPEDEVATANRGLFATKDFAAGEIVYEEEAVISTLLPRAQNGQFCYHCLKAIPGATPRVKKPEAEVEAEAEAAEDTPAPFEESKIEEIVEEAVEETVEAVEDDEVETKEVVEEVVEETVEETVEEVVEEV
ncbi:mitochondrial import receptor subunit tom20, partial [Linderina macrospora]